MPFENIGRYRPPGRGPLLDDDGRPRPIFFVECAGCGSDHPMVRGANGRYRLPDHMNRIAPVDENDRVCGPFFYATKGCTKNAAALIRRDWGDDAHRVVVITNPTVESIDLQFHLAAEESRRP